MIDFFKVIDKVDTFLPKEFSSILNSDPKLAYLTIDGDYITEIFDKKYAEGFGVEFLFGEKTLNSFLDFNFECQQCGYCCRERYKQDGSYCEHVEDSDDKKICGIYQDRSLTCEIYPFVMHPGAQVGKGRMMLLDHPKEESYIELGLVDEALVLQLYPFAPHGKGNNTLKEQYANVLVRLANINEKENMAPPIEDILQYRLRDPDIRKVLEEKFGEISVELLMNKFCKDLRNQLISMKPRFLEELKRI
jgi:Fe-S-cluster containining protein